jgi:PAS domain S-box-containing protein
MGALDHWTSPLGAAWRALRQVPPTPVALAVVWLAAGGFALRGYRAAEDDTLRLAAMQARLLTDHTARALGAVDLVLDAASSRLVTQITESTARNAPRGDTIQRTLADVVAGQPMVRSLSIVQEGGYIEASSQAVNTGNKITPVLFLPKGGNGPMALRLASGRDLADASLHVDAGAMHHVLLVARPMPAAEGHTQSWLVAALNPEYFATQHELILTGPGWRSALLTPDGTVLAATSNLALGPGTPTVLALPADGPEAGQSHTHSLSGEPSLSAWRLAQRHPVGVHVELSRSEALADWRGEAERTVLVAGVVSALVAALALAARRHRRAREASDAERERAQQQLREQYTLTEQLVDAMAVPVFLTDLDGNLLLANRAWVKLLGLEGDDGTAAEGSERRTRVMRLLERGIAEVCTTGSTQWPLDLATGEGSLRETVVTKVALRGEGDQVRGVIGTLVDVTEYKQAARATESARRAAEAANQARAEFVANVTHELRTPLQSILGFAELGEGRADGQEKLQLMFRRVHQAGGRMLKLVDELLDISRIGSTVGSIKLRQAPVAEPLREVVDELRPLAQQRGLTLKLRVDDALQDAHSRLDPPRLQQVLRNVLANALRFAPTGTSVEVTLQSEDGMAVAAVRDQGPGVPVDEVESIFEPFVQSSRTKDGSGGTGLGLAICRQIMQAHGGFIVASNHSQGGAVFRFGLPLAAAPAKTPADETA